MAGAGESKYESHISNFIFARDIQVRPKAAHGLWLMYLLPIVIITSTFRNFVTLTDSYKLWLLVALGIFLKSSVLHRTCLRGTSRAYELISNLIIVFFIAALFHKFLHRGLAFSVYSALFSSLLFQKLWLVILKHLPKSFTLGEAGIVAQGLILFLYSLSVNVYNAVVNGPVIVNMQISTLIMQFGLLTVGLIGVVAYKYNLNTPVKFYGTTLTSVVLSCFLPLHFLLQRSPVLWILNFIFSDLEIIKLVLYWSVCCALATVAVSKQIWYGQKASTSMRKVFHILAVFVHIPGLIHRCSFLYLASGVVLGIFIALELVRIMNVPPFGQSLQDGYFVFSDEKDTGLLALTPIYLHVACSLPLWLHPSPCDVTDSTTFTLLPLLSGLLSIGIGDTAASVVGSAIGKHKYRGSNKTIEGTIACLLSQGIFVGLMIYFGYLQIKIEDLFKIVYAIFACSLVEARTEQVDNLTLPLIMYEILELL